jgi:hypothetical protein
MDQDYAQKLKAQVQAIFDRGPGGDLPQWPAEYDEAAYNKLAAKTLGGTLTDGSSTLTFTAAASRSCGA